MLPGRRGLRLLAGVAVLTASTLGQAPLYEIGVRGNQRFRSEDIISTTGLRLNQAVTRDDFDAATKKLSDSGLFSSVNYHYNPKVSRRTAGFVLTLEVVEEPASRLAEIDIPGFDEEKLWQELKRDDPLIGPRMPDNERAVEFYRLAIQKLLQEAHRQEEIVTKTETDMSTGFTTTTFLPAGLPKVGEVVFTGNQAIETAELEEVMAGAPGREFTERSFRRLLEANVKPLYEEKGYLTAKFSRVSIADGDPAIVTVDIQEGTTWSLGKVEFRGDHLPVDQLHKAAQFPTGKLANWKEITAAITRAEQVLRRKGFLEVESKAVRSLRPEGQVVDLTIEIDSGKQFLFGVLQLDGFPAERKAEALKLWTLSTGAPMDEPYIDEYVAAMLDSLKVGVKLAGKELRVRPGTNVVDVVLTFQPEPALN